MKKLYVLLAAILFSAMMMAQQVGRQKVIVEIATGTWCTYCPGAAMGADDLVANGCEVGVIEYHNGDPFANDASNYRNSYYAVSGYPTAHFDGVLEYVGGSHTVSMYSNYLPLYQQRIIIPSDFSIDIYGDNTGSTYDIQLVINKVSGSWGDLTVHLALTESEIVYSWQDQDHLNFVERLMAPSHLGTIVDFSSEDMVIVELSFNMSTDWVAAHCELVAFIQNEATKEILQGNMVAIPDLEPMPATAGFAANTVMPCITSTVEFEDESLGDIVSWNWAFEGGTPTTSTAQNPVVTYNTQGQYDVQLIVYDGSVYDTLMNPEYILVITPPVQPNTPTGPTGICQDQTNIQYSIPEVQWATTYVWDVEPNNAGTISGPDPVATFIPAPGYTGTYTIKVRADNNCGNGTWSPELNCETFLTPSEFTLSESAGYCEGDMGVQITLDGSEIGVNYELYLDGETTGQILAGTGEILDFGFYTESGIYSCSAFTDQCENEMIGNTYIWVIYAPAEPEMPEGSTQECSNNTGVIYTTEDVTGATGYIWTITPTDAGTITGDTEEASVDWNPDFEGTANIHVAAINACATGPASDDLAVTVYATPQPAVSGDQTVCDWEPGLIYNTPAIEGNTYAWEIMNGHITGGEGTNEITVTWHDPGTGWVKVTETNNDCVVTTENFEVAIEDCVGIGEEDITGFSLYPNPVKDEMVVRFNGKNMDRNLVIMNQLGKVILSEILAGEEQVIINTAELASGIYYIRVTEQGKVTDKKFIKVE